MLRIAYLFMAFGLGCLLSATLGPSFDRIVRPQASAIETTLTEASPTAAEDEYTSVAGPDTEARTPEEPHLADVATKLLPLASQEVVTDETVSTIDDAPPEANETGEFASLADMLDPASHCADEPFYEREPLEDCLLEDHEVEDKGMQLASLATVVDPAPADLDRITIPADELVAGPAAQVVHSNYEKATREAAEDRKMLFIYFHDTYPSPSKRAFESETLTNVEIQEKLKRYVFLKLPRDARITVGGKSIAVLEHPAFAEMRGRQGLAVIDFTRPEAEYYGHVVSTFPFTPGKYFRKEALSIVLDLPPGTLTQRTMIYAVRIHPEGPKSTQGQFHNVLADAAKNHAQHQASILLQGHHSWDSRFHQINAQLPSGVLAQEVVAESWPNESLVEACIECVDSWRQSPGHWGAVRSRHSLFGYDIKLGRNGIWYATGIFGRR